MSITEARRLVGRRIAVTWTDRTGQEYHRTGVLETTKFVPMYGAYLVVAGSEVSMEKVTGVEALD